MSLTAVRRPPLPFYPSGTHRRAADASDDGRCRTLAMLVRAGYPEMPCLALTTDRAARLWRIGRDTALHLFGPLTAEGFLRKTATGRFVWGAML